MILYNEDRVVTRMHDQWYKYIYRLYSQIYTNMDGKRLAMFYLYMLCFDRGGLYDVRG